MGNLVYLKHPKRVVLARGRDDEAAPQRRRGGALVPPFHSAIRRAPSITAKRVPFRSNQERCISKPFVSTVRASVYDISSTRSRNAAYRSDDAESLHRSAAVDVTHRRESTTTYRDSSLESHLWRAGSSGRVLIATGRVDRDIAVVQSPRRRDPPPQPRVEPSPSWRGGGEPAPRAGTDPPSRRRFRPYARLIDRTARPRPGDLADRCRSCLRIRRAHSPVAALRDSETDLVFVYGTLSRSATSLNSESSRGAAFLHML